MQEMKIEKRLKCFKKNKKVCHVDLSMTLSKELFFKKKRRKIVILSFETR
jgi:hypothetical protein